RHAGLSPQCRGVVVSPPPGGLASDRRPTRRPDVPDPPYTPPMESRATPTASYPRWWVNLAIWTAWGLLLATQVTWYTSLGTKPTPFLTALRLNLPGALVWAVFTPATDRKSTRLNSSH